MKLGLVMALVAAVCSSCSVFGPDALVNVVVPEPPEHWRQAFPDLWFLLSYRDGEGEECTARAAAGQTELLISCSKTGNSPVLAYPRTCKDLVEEDGPGVLKPAGGLYPSSLESSLRLPTLRLTWQDGPVACIMCRLEDRGLDVGLVNAARLSQYFIKATDPWSLDLDAIAQKLADGCFTAYDIQPLPGCPVELHPGPGRWFTESPFFIPAEQASEDALALPDLSYGLHYLFSLEGACRKVQVGRDEVILGPQGGQ